MASNLALCGVCESLQISKLVFVWCSDCNEGLCDDCEKRHSVSLGTRNHKTMPFEKFQELSKHKFQNKRTCSRHCETYQTYCQTHDCLCCHTCVIETHKTCDDVRAIVDVVKNVKSSNALYELEESLKDYVENVASTIRNKESNLVSLRNEKQIIEREIFDARLKVNKHLDWLQEKMIKELHAMEKKEQTKTGDFLAKLKEKEAIVKEFQKTLMQVKRNSSELDIFLTMKEIDKDSRNEIEKLKTLCTAKATKERFLTVKIHKNLRNLERNVKTFGYITMHSKFKNVNFEGRKDKQAQLITSSITTSVNDISLNLVKSFKTDLPGTIKSCALIPDEVSVFVCHVPFSSNINNVVFGIKPDGSKEFDISLNYVVRDIIFIAPSYSLAALCCRYATMDIIQMINLKNRRITQTIPLEKIDLHRVTYNAFDHSLVAIGYSEIQILNLADISLKTLTKEMNLGILHIAAYGKNIYYTDNKETRSFKSYFKGYKPGKIECCNIQGTEKWRLEYKTLSKPRGITVDNEGFVYVVGSASNNVVVFQPDGLQHVVLLTSSDRLRSPTEIDICRSTNQLLVANQSGECFLYYVNKQ